VDRHHPTRHHHRRQPRRLNRYDAHKVRARGQAFAMVVLAGGLLALLVVFVQLLGGDRDGTPLAWTSPGRPVARQ
jgi:hypothetical protein